MNTVSFSKVQTPDRTINQLQNNILTTFNQVGNDVNTLVLIGEIKYSPLTLAQVQQQLGASWVACNGATAVGSTYQQLTGALTVPNLTPVSGISAYIRIN